MVSDKDNEDPELQWLKNIPYDTRQLAIKEYVGSYKAAKQHKKQPNMTFKLKKATSHVFHIDKNALKNENGKIVLFKKRKLGYLRLRKTKRNKSFLKNFTNGTDCKLIKYSDGSYYLLITKQKIIRKKVTHNSIALDPGVRCFQTGYSPDGFIGEFGSNILDKVNPYTDYINKLNTLKTKSVYKTRRNMSLRQHKSRTKIKNIVNDFQWKLANYLCSNFETIITSNFNTSDMVKKENRTISKTTVKDMYCLSHFKFREKLKHKARQMNRRLIIINEAYTSKTCTSCGNIKDLKGEKIYKCDNCNLVIDRDINGARNIYLKTLNKFSGYDTSSLGSK